MDYHHSLLRLTSTEDLENAEDFNDMLVQIVENVHQILPENVIDEIQKTFGRNNNPREAYLKTLLYCLNGVRKSIPLDSNTFLGVNQFRSVKISIEIVISMMIPCLLPGVGIGIQHLCPRAAKLPVEDLTDLEKYDRLSATVQTIADCFDETTMRPAVLLQLGPLLAAFLQLSFAPLMKPCTENKQFSDNASASVKFSMSVDLYNKLKEEQAQFKARLTSMIDKAPQSIVIRELMIILGVQGAPKWLQRETRRLLVNRIMKPKGIASLVLSICDNGIDLGAHWSKLDIIAKLIAAPQSPQPEIYYESICSQLLDLLDSKARDSLIVTNWCINALYEKNTTIFIEKILNPILGPLLIKTEESKPVTILKTEIEVTKCIENLSKCFITTGAKFKCLPIKLLSIAAFPLFQLYNKAYRTAYLHRNTIRQLLLLLLNEESMQENLFLQFLDPENRYTKHHFGDRLTFQFGSTGEFEISSEPESLSCEELGDCLLNLVQSDPALSYKLFCYLLKSLSRHDKESVDEKSNEVLTGNDRDLQEMRDIEIKLVRTKLLSILAETSAIQEAHINKPEQIVSFIKSLIKENSQIDKVNGNDSGTEFNIMYISLMLVKVILTSKPKSAIDWKLFNELMVSLNEMECNDSQLELSSLSKEVVTIIKTQGASARPRYQDLSLRNQEATEFDKALRDLADPLLPVRAHGLMSLTKLIERSDPDTVAKKDVILCLFQENLKHEDSFIYLSAINGISTLATSYPKTVIELLVHEFINVTSNSKDSSLSPDTRAKIGEVLVRVTRSLGDLTPAYKNILINGFLCGTRDVDPLVRASSLSCLGELCKVLGYRLGNIITEVILCIGSIIKTDKIPECRRAAVLVATLMLQGLGKAALASLGSELLPLYRALLSLRKNDDDQVLRLHAQLAIDELDDIVRDFLISKPRLENSIFMLKPTV
ncbi:transport and Golgi organization protein 6 homolog [Athalia rosae]|uniref:transport and Golgi organization protein 6 homolog n=1 Tax=Athalia rosae TaxID=37344 RepID=UPI0020340A8B|nr:transport and Golgi organization protein 6 homolog [Athalia rosae]